jgi:hypothetical protein
VGISNHKEFKYGRNSSQSILSLLSPLNEESLL